MQRILISPAAVVMLSLLAACGGESAEETDTDVAAAPGASAAGGMPGMQGMQGMGAMQDSAMMQRMQAHMQMMSTMSPDSVRAMMPQHRQMADSMLARMDQRMGQMNNAGDPAWTATLDSLQQDLTRMPEMSPEEFEAFMPAHRARMTRLMEMHRSMMGNMPM